VSHAPTSILAPAGPQVEVPPRVFVLADFRGRFLTLASTPNHPTLSPLGSFAMRFETAHEAAWWLSDAGRACLRPIGFPALFVKDVDARLLDPAAELGRAIH
jgi:hypothetical protein